MSGASRTPTFTPARREKISTALPPWYLHYIGKWQELYYAVKVRIIIEAAGLEVTPALKAYIYEKLGALEKFEKNKEAEIFLEVSRTTKHHHKGMVFRAEANLKTGGTMLRAEANGKDIRTAIDEVKDELKREISHAKGKMTARIRRNDRRVK